MANESVAQDQLRAFIERIIRMREEAKAINDDIREIYAEAKANGFDKTVLGKVVAHVEKRSKDPQGEAERSAIFDLYLDAYDGGARDDVDVGTVIARAHMHETDHDPLTGEITEFDGSGPQATAVDAGEGSLHGSSPANPSHANVVLSESVVDRESPAAGPGGDEDRQQFPVAVEGSRSTRGADVGGDGEASSTAARKDVQDSTEGEVRAEPLDPAAATTLPADTQAPPVETIPDAARIGQGGVTPALPNNVVSITGEPRKRNWRFDDKAHHDCQRPEFCGGFSNNGICQDCKAALASDHHIEASA